jgi:putative transposase
VQLDLWRAVDQHGVVLDTLVQPRRDATAAKRFFRQLLRSLQHAPRVIVTDRLRSYGVAQRELRPKVEHQQSRYLDNRAENSHRPTAPASVRCNDLNHPRGPRSFSQSMLSFAVTFIHDDTEWHPSHIVRSG